MISVSCLIVRWHVISPLTVISVPLNSESLGIVSTVPRRCHAPAEETWSASSTLGPRDPA